MANRDSTPHIGDLVVVKYWDHVAFRNSNPLSLAPEKRIRYGRLLFESSESPSYIILVSDESAEPPTLRGGDPKSEGIVILCSDLLELRRLGSH
jgi:hypothetical protein